ncbi:C-GCAxxG-C-C family protein [Terrisporobacter mayombei]|uniref:C_GCAxxG_C_C family protein n=1 Tax=Terrisporobacter mayombei TaxID=1541 RepID=A0ABY9Q097_9FIRM|nr:C-GCAxxG-C-C family protein [Terrisporobacter mayombei]MCC3866779.1 C-GCAxxG-C-C family protein [Terrisporobacter mayombei]WMT81016.1 hypothetical protein TEMA_13480 [Terrisporobacter mayombei]
MKINELEIKNLFEQGYNCGQVVLTYYADKLNLDEEMALKITAGLGGGMFSGDSCGAVIAIGLKYGYYEESDLKSSKDLCTAKTLQFRHEFSEMFGSCMCKELLGYDISIPKEREKAFASGKLLEFCPCLVKEAINILDEIL